MDFIFSLLAFIMAISVLVGFHEFGHLWVAKKFGVKILRYSIGFGRPIWKTRRGPDQTEYVLASIPLGGYVRMLDEREGVVKPEEQHRAFNRQSLKARSAIVAAGPIANFLLAFILYFFTYMLGVPAQSPVVGEVPSGSPAAVAGLERGDLVVVVGEEEVRSWQEVIMALVGIDLQADYEGFAVRIQKPVSGLEQEIQVRVQDLDLLDDPDALLKLGMQPWRPVVAAIIGELLPAAAAERAGLLPGDRMLVFQGENVRDWKHFVELIRDAPDEVVEILVEREGLQESFTVQLGSMIDEGRRVGRLGARAQLPPSEDMNRYRFVHRYGPLQSLQEAARKTWQLTSLTFQVLWQLLTGEASVRNLSGPITIADYAGDTLAVGVGAFLSFLAVLSLSIGIINLLPIPILDGGHLLFFLVEWLKGSPLSTRAQAFGQSIGMVLLIGLMLLAFYNDFVRLVEG